MPITLTVAGVKTKFANEAVEAAFRQAIAETEPTEVRVSSAVAAVSKIANSLGLAETCWRNCGNGATARQLAYSEAILLRVAAILGCDALAGTFRDDPTETARAVAAAWADFQENQPGHVRLEFSLNRGKPWVAGIHGAHGEYRFDRSFLQGVQSPDGERIVFWLAVGGFYQSEVAMHRVCYRVTEEGIVVISQATLGAQFPGRVVRDRPRRFEEVEGQVNQLEFEGDQRVRPEHERFG